MTHQPPAQPRPGRLDPDKLIASGRLAEAVDGLTELRTDDDPVLDIRLRDLRARAAASWDAPCGLAAWPPVHPDPFPHVVGRLPEVDLGNLTAEILGGAVAHHGALVVRGVLDREDTHRHVAMIDRIHARRGPTGVPPTSDDPAVEALFRPLRAGQKAHDPVLRRLIFDQGGTWLGDSPLATAVILRELTSAGITGIVAAHLGERPFFSLQKSTLRRTEPVYDLVSWHQDGAFLGPAVRTMNVWVALSACGGDRPTPALEVFPQSFDHILPAEGGLVPNAVPDDVISELSHEMPTVVPEFAPGDAVLFDERFLHRTYLTESMTDIRYALECWFFAPSHQSPAYTPLLA